MKTPHGLYRDHTFMTSAWRGGKGVQKIDIKVRMVADGGGGGQNQNADVHNKNDFNLYFPHFWAFYIQR